MAYPTPYARQFSFTDFARTSPGTPLPGLQVDTELNAVKIFLDLLDANIRLIQRDDGALQNASVGLAQLKTEVAFGLNSVSTWAGSTQYFVLNGVWYQNVLYRCVTDHISDSDFATDLAAGYWSALVDFTVVLGLATTAQTAAETAQTAAELAETNAQTSETNASTSATQAATSAATSATSATASATSEANAAQSEIDVAAAIAGLFDPTVNANKMLRSDGTTFVPTAATEASDGRWTFPGGINTDFVYDLAGGALFQQIMSSGHYTDSGASTTSETFTNILQTAFTITPVRNDTKIVFFMSYIADSRRDGSSPTMPYRFYSATSAAAIGPEMTHQLRAEQSGSNTNIVKSSGNMVREHRPASTSTQTYELQVRVTSASSMTGEINQIEIHWMEILE